MLFQKFISSHWAINNAKQILGKYTHEFLQRETSQNGEITQPINSALAALSSG